MTTPTQLAETIARVAHTLESENVTHLWEPAFRDAIATLLSCARRCEAIDGVEFEGAIDRLDRASRNAVAGPSGVVAAMVTAADLECAVELAADRERLQADRDALAKRVGELEADLASALRISEARAGQRDELSRMHHAQEDESTRLRAENERLALLVKETADLGETEVANVLRRLTAAQDRVRELEEALKTAQSELDEWRPDTVNDGPITDPTQGVGAIPSGATCPNCCTMNEYTVPAPQCPTCATKKPSCIPADCQHFEQLPSGLWAWVDKSHDGSAVVCVDDRGCPVPWYLYESGATDAYVSTKVPEVADFLAARELGVRVLGWTK